MVFYCIFSCFIFSLILFLLKINLNIYCPVGVPINPQTIGNYKKVKSITLRMELSEAT